MAFPGGGATLRSFGPIKGIGPPFGVAQGRQDDSGGWPVIDEDAPEAVGPGQTKN
jgi:hypothetical protein